MRNTDIRNLTVKSFEITPTLDTDPYISGDLLFNPVKVCDKGDSNRRGLIIGVDVTDADDQGENLDIWFGTGTESLGTINDAADLSEAEAKEWFGKIAVTTWSDLTSVQKGTDFDDSFVPYGLGLDDKELYAFGVSKGSGTYTADGLTIRVWIASDES